MSYRLWKKGVNTQASSGVRNGPSLRLKPEKRYDAAPNMMLTENHTNRYINLTKEKIYECKR